MKPHKYPMILAEMDKKQISREDIATELNIGANTWTKKIRGDADITLPEAYKVLKALKLPTTDIFKYFPEVEKR